jgi:hypothetical protein
MVLFNTESGEDLDDYEDDDEEAGGEGEEREGGGEQGKTGKKRRVKPVTHLPPTEDNTALNYISPLNHVDAANSPTKPPPAPVTPLFEAKKQTLKAVVPNAHKQQTPQQPTATSVQTFLNFNPKNKKILGNSRDSLMSSLSRSEDEDENEKDGLTVQSEPYRKQKPTERPVTPYETLVRINKLKDYGDFLENELESYLSNEEFMRIFGKSRVRLVF